MSTENYCDPKAHSHMHAGRHTIGRAARSGVPAVLLAATLGLGLAACAGPEGYTMRPVSAAPVPEPPPTTVYFYPKHGQSKKQQDRDHYECYLWAVKQTGYDPGAAPPAPGQRVAVEPSPPSGHDTAVGAATGAVLGAAVSSPRHAGEGAVVGAITGAMVGAASDAARQQQAERVQRQYDRQAQAEATAVARRANDFRRALGACLEGRGYTVR